MNQIKRITIVLIVISITILNATLIIGQSGSSGHIFIQEGGSLTIFGEHNFLKGNSLIKAGTIKTERQGEKGYLNFTDGSSWTGADQDNFIDGYAKVFHDQPFIFPLGQNGVYRPIMISGGANTSAAYYAESPPSPSSLDTEIQTIASNEYWDIKGETPIAITLYLDKNSPVATLARTDSDQLQIIGYKDGVWKSINSSLEQNDQVFLTAIKNVAKQGAFIATVEKIIPNEYDYFTLGIISPATKVRANLQEANFSLYPNPVKSELFINLDKFKGESGTVSIYNLYGQLIEEQVYDSSNSVHFNTENYLNGLYELKVQFKNRREMTQKFLVQNLY